MEKNREQIQEYYEVVKEYFDTLLVGEEKAKNAIIFALLCDKNSRILISGKPGTGKSTISDSIAKSFTSRKISITADLLPSEILNTFIECPDIELVQLEEINRTSPKVQGGLIEILGSNSITIDNETKRFNDFLCIATQNDTEVAGIFDTPTAIYDRFDINVSFGNLSFDEIREVLFRFKRNLTEPNINLREIVNNSTRIIDEYEFSDIDEEVFMDAVKIIHTSEHYNKELFGSSNMRGYEYLKRMSVLNALINGKTYILPCHIAEYISNIFLHRVNQSVMKINSNEAKSKMKEIEEKILSNKRPSR